MPKPSLRDVYEAVEKVPPALKRAAKKNPPECVNIQRFIDLLFVNPRKVKVGEWQREDHKIHLCRKTDWSFVMGRKRAVRRVKELSEAQLSPAIVRVNDYLATLNITFRAWSSCKRGNPRVKAGGNCRKERAPFLIGLVDISRPMKPSNPKPNALLVPKRRLPRPIQKVAGGSFIK